MTLTQKDVAVESEIGLHLMVNQLTVSNMPNATKRRNQLLNEVPPELSINTDSHKLAAILHTLIFTVLGQSQDNCIRISAKAYDNVTIIHIEDNKKLAGSIFSGHVGRAQQMAESIGGTVLLNEYREGRTRIAVSILNN
jgi:hypothetical protein